METLNALKKVLDCYVSDLIRFAPNQPAADRIQSFRRAVRHPDDSRKSWPDFDRIYAVVSETPDHPCPDAGKAFKDALEAIRLAILYEIKSRLADALWHLWSLGQITVRPVPDYGIVTGAIHDAIHAAGEAYTHLRDENVRISLDGAAKLMESRAVEGKACPSFVVEQIRQAVFLARVLTGESD